MKFSPASQEDMSRIAFLEMNIEGSGAACLEVLKSRFAMFSEGFLVAKDSSGIVGYVETCIWKRETPLFNSDPGFFPHEHTVDGNILYVIFVGVDESQRRFGIGSHIVRNAVEVGRNFSVTQVHAVSRDNIIPFYESLGFVAVKSLPGFLSDQQNYTLMEFCL